MGYSSLFVFLPLFFFCEAWIDPLPSCLFSGVTWNQSNIILVEVGFDSPEECQSKCYEEEMCSGFTWLSDESTILPHGCLLFSELSEELSCDKCFSGPPKCLCTVHGECMEQDMNMIQAIPEVMNIAECEDQCHSNSNCSFYTYLDDLHPAFKHLCLLYDKCDTVIEECEGCTAGAMECHTCSLEATVDGRCSCDGTMYGTSCYKLLDNNGLHYDHRDECIEECNRLGGNLTSIHTEEENVFLASLLKPNAKGLSTFIGADEVTSKNFVWRDGTDWDYENWYSGDPNGNKGCVLLGYSASEPAKWVDI